jgi:hypothetical protein
MDGSNQLISWHVCTGHRKQFISPLRTPGFVSKAGGQYSTLRGQQAGGEAEAKPAAPLHALHEGEPRQGLASAFGETLRPPDPKHQRLVADSVYQLDSTNALDFRFKVIPPLLPKPIHQHTRRHPHSHTLTQARTPRTHTLSLYFSLTHTHRHTHTHTHTCMYTYTTSTRSSCGIHMRKQTIAFPLHEKN